MKTKICIFSLFLLLIIIYFFPIVKDTIFNEQRNLIFDGGDIVTDSYVQWSIILKAFAEKVIPWWDPFIHCGTPCFSNVACIEGLFYFGMLLHYFIPLTISFTILFILNYLIAGIGIFILSRAMELSTIASFVAGVTFMFCGFFFDTALVGHIAKLQSVVWMPYFFYIIEKFLKVNTIKGYLKLMIMGSLIIALDILGGHWQFLYINIIIIVTYSLFNLIWRWIDTGKINFHVLGFCLIIIIAGMCLAAVQFIPTIGDIYLTNRGNFKGEYLNWGVSDSVFCTEDLIKILAPFVSKEVANESRAYLGILPLFFAFGVVLFYSQFSIKNRRKILFLFFMTLGGLMLSFGRQFPFFAIQYCIPILRTFRIPSRSLVIWHFGISLLTAFGIDGLLKYNDDKIRRRIMSFSLLIGIFFGLLVISTKPYRTNQDLLYSRDIPLFFIVISMLAYICCSIFQRQRRYFIFLSVFIIIIDLFGYRYLNQGRDQKLGVCNLGNMELSMFVNDVDGFMRAIKEEPPHDAFYRIAVDTSVPSHSITFPCVLKGIFLYDGPYSQYLTRISEIQKSARTSLGALSPVYDLFGVRYIFSEKSMERLEPNLSLFSTVSSSSQFSGLPISNINDNNIGSEWASQGEMTPWVKLSWPYKLIINKIILRDRPNLIDEINNSYLKFSDGSAVNVGSLPNDGSKKEIIFPDKTVTWIEFIVTSGSGQNIGLAELEVYYDFNLGSSSQINSVTNKYKKITENVYLNQKALPRVFIVHKAVVLGDKEDIFRLINLPYFKPSEVGILEKGGALDVAGPYNDEANIVEYDFNEVRIRTKSDRDGILILADAYHPGWRAWIDGKKAEIFPVDWAVRGVYLPVGEHEVKFYFLPWYYKLGIGISLVSLLLFTIVFIKVR